ncbi:rhomboid family intramembrane serine protease [Tengunoibacter tsumagoiensis]|uniref:Peptidase S54 rhomboid domain-containing protein n=1 Tax=Tengunoibacter tsumagoiensis TaxID=2014871 RepID=A0A402A491_9CHLR|nr:rhomboid family intramembrane serine protease [Tengunoibacter tsumagoiensis]GCE13974.1 hypothetical protein KTT_38330 [Tengunoibacter tsumagoiensis]
MEAQTEIQTYLEQGKQALAAGKGRDAAIAYAHGAQIEPNNPLVHLGLAEANLALGNYGVVQMACRRVQELQTPDGLDSKIAQALLDLLDRRYERALQNVDAAIEIEPGIAYLHALRSYLLRATGQDYDANLARARATRLSYGGRFENCFPVVDVKGSSRSTPTALPGSNSNQDSATVAQQVQLPPQTPEQRREEKQWKRPDGMRRTMIRTRYTLSQYPFLLTFTLIAINVVVYLLVGLNYHNLLAFDGVQIFFAGGQNSYYIQQTGEYWRIFVAMFLHFDITHLGLNMLSLFFIGRGAEVFYGKWRYLVIYLGSGVLGGLVTYFYYLQPQYANTVSAGASGAIFGVFGALGVFYMVNRRALGVYGRGAIGNWAFWLLINMAWGFNSPSIGIVDHIAGLVIGMIIAFLLIPRGRRIHL